jgi:hypothetical protein
MAIKSSQPVSYLDSSSDLERNIESVPSHGAWMAGGNAEGALTYSEKISSKLSQPVDHQQTLQPSSQL